MNSIFFSFVPSSCSSSVQRRHIIVQRLMDSRLEQIT
ncbi:unnamed protein product [Arabidopsis lyrata]|nr:unnamed protein product [Arabidopsis lyrata]